LLWRYAPALLDQGPLDLPCVMARHGAEPTETYANTHGISEHELWLLSSATEAQA
jgi:hypothetical protein